MRILINDFAGHPFQVQLSRALAARGNEVLHCYCSSNLSPKGSLQKRADDAAGFSVQAIQIGTPFEKYGLLKRWSQERAIGHAIVEKARAFKPDIIVSANTPLGTQGVLLRFSRARHIPFVYWVQDMLSFGIDAQLRLRLPVIGAGVGLAFQKYERLLLARSSHIVSITKDFLDYFPKQLKRIKNVTVIENWAPLDELPVLMQDNTWSAKHGLGDKLCILYSGTLGLKHNPDLLVRLATQFAARNDVQVVVISEGMGADYLAKKKSELGLQNLTLLPFQAFDEMPQVLASAEVLVAILEKEAGVFAVPSKVLTYLCAERALLLAIPYDNLAARIVREHGAGLTAAPDDADAFVQVAERLIGDKNLRLQMARKGRAYAENTFDIQRIVSQFEEVFAMASH